MRRDVVSGALICVTLGGMIWSDWRGFAPTQKEEIMAHLILQGDDTTWNGFSLLGESSLAITFDETGIGHVNTLDFLVLSGTPSVSIASTGVAGGSNVLPQLAEKNNDLTTVTISGSEQFFLGSATLNSNSGDGVVTDIAATATSPTKIASSLKLIDASATTGGVDILAGATNTSDAGPFRDGAILNPNITITYGGLTIKGGSGNDIIDNDAKNGIVHDGNGTDTVILGGASAKATLGTGTGDKVFVGTSLLGPLEAAGVALGDSVTFGAAPTALLIVRTGAEAGSTAGTASIGETKVHDAAAGMNIDFKSITTSSNIVDETAAVASATNLTAAEDAAVNAMAGPGVAFFNFRGNEYFIATDNTETAVSSHDAIVKLVGVIDLHATNSSGLVTLHA
jgi:hypothetical protein